MESMIILLNSDHCSYVHIVTVYIFMNVNMNVIITLFHYNMRYVFHYFGVFIIYADSFQT